MRSKGTLNDIPLERMLIIPWLMRRSKGTLNDIPLELSLIVFTMVLRSKGTLNDIPLEQQIKSTQKGLKKNDTN